MGANRGGGIFSNVNFPNSWDSLVVRHCIFTANTADGGDGAALYWSGTGNITVDQCTFYQNSGTTLTTFSCDPASSLTFSNNLMVNTGTETFVEFTGYSNGGTSNGSTGDISSSTFIRNTGAQQAQPLISIMYMDNATIENVIVRDIGNSDHEAFSFYGCNQGFLGLTWVMINNSNIQGLNSLKSTYDAQAQFEGCIDQAPVFTGNSFELDAQHIYSRSSAYMIASSDPGRDVGRIVLQAGNNKVPNYDILGVTRIENPQYDDTGDPCDIGAYEY
jgi:hypothetical protein